MHEGQWMAEANLTGRIPMPQPQIPDLVQRSSPQFPEQSRESDAAPWTWWQLVGSMAVILLFAGDIGYHFATLQWHYLPADQRLNNGANPTFFAFHIDPYY